MKKIVYAALTLALCSAAAFAQDEPTLKLSGDAKTGVYWQQVQEEGRPVNVDPNALRIESHDGDPNGNRYRLNMDYDNGNSLGMRSRIDWTNWSNTDQEQPKWRYAFAYGNFFEDQLTVAIGKLGGSPWGTGGPEKWKELEQQNQGGGMRVEIKPGIFPDRGWGRLNAGFVLNYLNSYNEAQSRTASFVDLLRESVLGVSYTHEFFMARLAYRLDSELDRRERGTEALGREGDDFIYRVEEYALREFLPGMQVWALGEYVGVFADDPSFYKFENWIFAQYDPPELGPLDTPFTAQIRLGYDYIEKRSEFHVKPSFYWHISIGEYQKLFSVGAMFSYRQDFGNKVWDGSPYQQIEIEPKIQINFTSSYIAFVYNWKQEYLSTDYPERGDKDPTKRTQFINLRFCIYY